MIGIIDRVVNQAWPTCAIVSLLSQLSTPFREPRARGSTRVLLIGVMTVDYRCPTSTGRMSRAHPLEATNVDVSALETL